MKIVFRNISYILLAVILSVFFLAFVIYLPNISFLKHVVDSSDFDFQAKVNIFTAMLGAINTNFTPFSRIIILVVAVLFGVNFAMLTFHLRQRIKMEKTVGAGFIGTIAGLLGVGCASCGSVILTSIFGLGATASFIGILPLKGLEFGILSIAILIFSIYLLSKKINDPLICKK